MNKELEPIGGLTPEEIAANANGFWKTKQNEGHPVSQRVAISLIMQQLGREILQKTIVPIDESQQAVQKDIVSILRSLTPEKRADFSYGIGGVFFGSIMLGLEQAAINGKWDEDVVMDSFNNSIGGTGLLELNKAMFKLGPKERRPTPEIESKNIREELSRDNSFLGFFEPDFNKLPQNLKLLLSGQNILASSLSAVIPTYKKALEYILKED